MRHRSVRSRHPGPVRPILPLVPPVSGRPTPASGLRDLMPAPGPTEFGSASWTSRCGPTEGLAQTGRHDHSSTHLDPLSLTGTHVHNLKYTRSIASVVALCRLTNCTGAPLSVVRARDAHHCSKPVWATSRLELEFRRPVCMSFFRPPRSTAPPRPWISILPRGTPREDEARLPLAQCRAARVLGSARATFGGVWKLVTPARCQQGPCAEE